MISVLHITPHLGGGIGKALSGLVTQASNQHTEVQHQIACLETPIKTQFVDQIRDGGGEVIIAPHRSRLDALIAAADIVQLEWWNHPATIECLCTARHQPIRLLVWCHVSGLYNPTIPPRLIESSHRFIFTSPCSFEAPYVARLAERLGNRLGVISSGGGFANLPEPVLNAKKPLGAGYIGSLNFAKLHPDYVSFLSAVRLPGFRVRMIGDPLNHDQLLRQSIAAGLPDLLDFRGYTTDVAAELRAINVLAYILNPRHYGTAENALLESMAMGIVPIVLDNPCERNIVEHGKTGLVVRSPDGFAKAIEWLASVPEERSRIGLQAATSVRERFTLENMVNSFNAKYCQTIGEEKRHVDFTEIFGSVPDQWFLSCQAEREYFRDGGQLIFTPDSPPPFDLLETTKGSVFHFHDYFPQNANLAGWSTGLKTMQEDQRLL